MFLIAIFHKVT